MPFFDREKEAGSLHPVLQAVCLSEILSFQDKTKMTCQKQPYNVTAFI